MTRKSVPLELWRQRLKESGVRLTQPRDLILRALQQQRQPVSIQSLFDRLEGACDWATIFRTMRRFESLGIVVRSEFGDKQSRFELASDPTGHHHHHHLVCSSCHKVVQLDECELDGLDQRIEAASGFSDITHSLEFFGTCPRCHSKRKA